MTGKKIVRMMALALPVMALMAAGPILVTQSHSSDSVSAGISERPGKQLTLTFTNDTGVEVDGLQIEFKRVPAGIQSVKVEPFKSTMAILKSNVLVLTNGRVGPGEKVRLTVLADPMGLAVTDFQWIRQGVLIAGKSRQIEIEERVINRETVSIDRTEKAPEPLLVSVRFELTNGLSRLFVTQGMMVAEGALLAIKDQVRFEQLMNEIARAKNLKEREKLQAELKKLEVRAPISGLVRELVFDVGEETTKVEAKLMVVAGANALQ
jgi:multidrug efflux pump subunit AcrA (membrane-fusion protein)